MGYSTDFEGKLRFKNPLSVDQLKKISTFFGEDCRDHPEWFAPMKNYKGLCYIDLKLTDDLDGVEWNESEKTYYMVEVVNLITEHMRREWPDFSFTGQLRAYGEDHHDRWILKIDENGIAQRVETTETGDTVTCPECGHNFEIE